MEEVDFAILARFEEVWQRVQAGNQKKTELPCSACVELMDGVHTAMCSSRQLAKLTSGSGKKRLLCMADCLERAYIRLQLQHFLESGEVYFASSDTCFASYTPYNLRKLWQSTVKNIERLGKCNLNDDGRFIAELQWLKSEFEKQKRWLECNIQELLQ